MTDKEYWFKNKNYGWGWTPNTTKGWIITALLLVGLIKTYGNWPAFATVIALFITVIIYKAPKPKWKWGNK